MPSRLLARFEAVTCSILRPRLPQRPLRLCGKKRVPAEAQRALRVVLLVFVSALPLRGQTPPAPKPETTVDAANGLQFAFREQKWLDVLDWFARQADLSLVVNEVPPGSFTYSDTRSYTPNEALDLLNGVLSTRGFALIRRDRMLVCANLAQGPPEGLIPRVELNELDRYGQFELVEVMFPLGRRPAQAVSDEVKPLLGPHGRVTTLAQTKQLLVMTTAGKMRAVSAIISSIPEPEPPKPEPEKPKPPAPTLVVYPAKNVDAKAAVEILNAMVAGATLTIDSRSNQINAYATPPQHEVIKQLLEQMATTTEEQLRPLLQVYDMQHEAPDILLQQLRLVVPKATLTLDPTTNRLIAFATPPDQQLLRETMQTLQMGTSGPLPQVPMVYSLQQVPPQTVLTMLQTLFPRAKVTADTASQRLVVLASLEQQTAIRQFLEQLQTQPGNPPRIREYPLAGLEAERMQQVVSSLVPEAKLTIDKDANRLLVIATEAQQTQVAELLSQLAEASRPAVARVVRLYDVTSQQREQFTRNYLQLDPQLRQIKLLDAGTANRLMVLASDQEHARLAELLDQIKAQLTPPERRLVYYDVAAGLRQKFITLRNQLAPDLGEIQLVEDPADPRLGIVATDDQHRQVRLLLDELQRNLPTEAARLKVFAVTPTQRSRFVSLKSSIDPQLGSVRIVDESRPNELVVWGTDDQLGRIESLLATLRDTGPAADMQLVTYPLEAGDPATVQKLLGELYPDTKILVDSESRRVMVWTTAQQHEVIGQAIRQLDAPPAAGKRRMVYYRLGEIDARDVERLFQQLVPKMSLISDRDTNSIIAWGTDKEHELLAKTVEDFRQQATQGDHTVVRYPCGTLDPDRLRRLLSDLVPRARFVSDPTQRALVVWADAADHKAIAEALQQMTHADEMGDATLKTYSLALPSAAEVIPLLQKIAPLAQFTSTDNGRRLLVWASSGQHELLETALRQIEGGEPGEQVVRVYPLGRTPPSVVTPLLDPKLVDGLSLIPDTARNALIVRAPAARHEALANAIDSILQGLPAVRERVSRVYRLQHAQPAALQTALAALVPTATLSVDTNTRSLIAAAFPEDQQLIESTVQQLDQRQTQQLQTRTYRLTFRNSSGVRDAVQQLAPAAVVVSDRLSRMLLVTASEEDQAKIAEVIKQMAEADSGQRETKVYRLEVGDVQAARDALSALLSDAEVDADKATRSLVVTAGADQQQRAAAVVEQLDQPPPANRETRVYALQRGDVQATQRVLQALLPDAVFANDPANKTLVATATTEQQQQIGLTVQDMDRANPQEPVLQAYTVIQANVQTVSETLRGMYERNPQVAITSDTTNRSLLVKAPAADQQTIAQIVARMENGAAGGAQRTLVVYPIDANNADATLAMFKTLLKDQQPPVELSLNLQTRQLVAVATPAQHAILAEATRQLQSEPYLVEVFPLQTADPFAVETAIERLYEGETAKPIANGDTETQQLFVRGTRRQLEEVRELLAKMGELPAHDAASQRGVRVIPFRGDVGDALKQLEEIWPQLRANRLRVMRPVASEPLLQPVQPRVETFRPADQQDKRDDSPDQPDPDDQSDARRRAANAAATQTRLTAQPQVGADQPQPAPRPAEPPAASDAPVLVVPQQGAVTLLSDDEAALNQAEALLRMLARQSQMESGAGNFAVYSLRNAGARNVTKLMTELFEQMPLTTRATVGRVSMVADERLNAVVVHGRPADRAVIAELLRVLDSSNVPDSLANARPVIVPVEYLKAARVLEILQGVYETQLETGGRRPEIEIPEGVSSDVATLLRQINAASSAPLLTLQLDEVTNSIVILAPSELGQEVAMLIKQLDENARQNDSRNVSIVSLQETNVEQLEKALGELLRTRRR